MPKNILKAHKGWLAVSSLLLALVLMACGDTATPATTTVPPTTATTTSPSTTAGATTNITTAAVTSPVTTTNVPTTSVAATTMLTMLPTTIATTTVPTTVATTVAATTTTVATTAATTTTVTTTVAAQGTGSTNGDPAKGKVAFLATCTGCHPNGGTDAGFGPNLSTSLHAIDPAYITFNVRNGRNLMPNFGKDKVSDEDLTNIIAYLKSIHKG